MAGGADAGGGHRTRRRFGQNFLRDPQVVDRLLRAIRPRPGDRLLEIGPGQGALTLPLLREAGALTVIELDRDLAGALRRRQLPGLTVLQGDALTFDLSALAAGPAGSALRVVGNLPYNISTPLLFRLLEQIGPAAVGDMHFMLQKEVVERLAAAPGSGDYGRLSVMVQYFCRVEALFTVGPGAFRPAPKVESAVVRLTPHARPPVVVDDPARLSELVAQAFSQRRKTLRNSLKRLLDEGQIAAAGVDPAARPETLTLQDFARLCERWRASSG